jgi:cyanophycinase
MARRVLLAGLCALACLAPVVTMAAPPTHQYFRVGNPSNAVATGTGGMALMGGGLDIDAAFAWMNGRSGGGDFLVIRSSGTDAYNQWVYDMGGVNSAATMIIKNRNGAFDPVVAQTIRDAEALFIAGGDQSVYVADWKGTPVEDAIHDVVARGGVIGGTSAGLAVMGEFVYTGENGSATSSGTLANPFNRYVTLTRDFLVLPDMGGKLTDSHFVERDRMGRFVGFLARLINDGWASSVKGIAIDSQTAFLVLPNGSGTLEGPLATRVVYFFSSNGAPQVCQPKTPLTYRNLPVYKVSGNANFNIRTWTGSGGVAYTVSAEAGVLTSTQPGGNPY